MQNALSPHTTYLHCAPRTCLLPATFISASCPRSARSPLYHDTRTTMVLFEFREIACHGFTDSLEFRSFRDAGVNNIILDNVARSHGTDALWAIPEVSYHIISISIRIVSLVITMMGRSSVNCSCLALLQRLKSVLGRSCRQFCDFTSLFSLIPPHC